MDENKPSIQISLSVKDEQSGIILTESSLEIGRVEMDTAKVKNESSLYLLNKTSENQLDDILPIIITY